MGKQLDFERYFWFHRQLKNKSFPSKKNLMDQFEIEARTAERSIQFMRHRLKAPIDYSRPENGYYYSDSSYEFPPARFTEKEIMGLIIADRLAHSIPDKRIVEKIDSLTEKFSFTIGVDVKELKKHISIKNMRYDKAAPDIFEKTIEALNRGKKLWMEYKSRNSQNVTERTVNPLHLLLYKGNWHLLAFCDKRKELRNFAVSGILHAEVSDAEKVIPDEISQVDMEKLIDENYGIFIHENKAERIEVSLKFTKEVADIVKNQVWFPVQNLEEEKDGSIILTFPVTDFREIEYDILKYGANVEVLNPIELRKKIKETIDEMGRIY